MKIVHKPWGKEEWLELNDRYCYKRIYINKGYKTSYQYHNFKRETNYIISGEAEVWLENDEGVVEKKLMKAGDFFNVTPPKKHRVIALTDIILQEVSTPEVDDVIRIDDDSNRKDGKIEGEHTVPAALILSAGLGTRLQGLTKYVNKSLVPLGEKAVISHIIEKFPKDYEIVIACGYKSESLKEYCQLAHTDRNITFIDVGKFEGEGTGPGYSALQCKSLLQRPFYLVTADCLIAEEMPKLDGNWLAAWQTSYPEKYSTIQSTKNGDILSIANKKENGFEDAFIGLCGIRDYEIFWNELERNIKNGELVCAWDNVINYPQLKVKKLKWFDVGNLDDFEKAQDILKVRPLSLSKDVGEFTYKVGNKFLKFNQDCMVSNNRYFRAARLLGLAPPNLQKTNHFISYDWIEGKTLYSLDEADLYLKFIEFYFNIILTNSKLDVLPREDVDRFYKEKTYSRVSIFCEKYGEHYYFHQLLINGKTYPPLKSLIDDVFEWFWEKYSTTFIFGTGHSLFHGDLQFDNIIYNNKQDRFYYLDWRESFAGNVKMGCVLYDLAKLYGGCLISYHKMKNPSSVSLSESYNSVDYKIESDENLLKLSDKLLKMIQQSIANPQLLKTITALIFINMAPLHDECFGKALWCKGIEMLHENK